MRTTLREILLVSLVSVAHPMVFAGAVDEKIWFDRPALHYTESCPLGNGRLGAMLFGGVSEERVVLNETGMWSGSPFEWDRPDAVQHLPEIQRLLFTGRGKEADSLVQERFTSIHPGKIRVSNEVGRAPGAGSVIPFGCFQTLGNLRLKMQHAGGDAAARDYRRELDLTTAVASVTYRVGDVTFKREAFVTAPDDAIILRLTADHPGVISFTAELDRPEKFETVADGDSQLVMSGQLEDGVSGTRGVRYAARLSATARGGRVRTAGNRLEVSGADEVTLLVTAITDIRTFAGRRDDEPAEATARDIDRVTTRGYAAVRDAHIADYQQYYRRTNLSLGATAAALAPTPERIQMFHRGGDDMALVALFFNYGRYLLISSSRAGGLPPNLQGLWADEIQTAWNGDWHLDINLEMNYWPVDVAGLSDLFQPYFDYIASLQEPGGRTAHAYYRASGWVAHSFGNPWGFTSPGWNSGVATYRSSAWLCQGLWDHYVYTEDRAFLNKAYPILKGAALFFVETLVPEPSHGWLVTAPSNSPENPYFLPNGDRAMVCAGPAMENQQIRHLFDACIEASKVLGVDGEFARILSEKRKRLAPTRIGSDGRVMEWLEEYKEVDPHHRHISHLWALYPGLEITPKKTPELAEAARKSLKVRGDGGMGWSLAHKVALWARLGEGDRAFDLLKGQLSPVEPHVFHTKAGGGSYPNLFCAAPPFQIEGNLGAPAVIAEMLLQCNEGDLHLLPALPGAWPEGSARGLHARGRIVVDVDWANGKLAHCVIRGAPGKSCVVRYRGKTVTRTLPASGAVRLDGNLNPADPRS